MTRLLILSGSFEKAYKKFCKRYPYLQKSIDEALSNLEKDAFASVLKTHKLSGVLSGFLACSCGYDCRIVFSVEKDENGNEVILLTDIGTHDEVY